MKVLCYLSSVLILFPIINIFLLRIFRYFTKFLTCFLLVVLKDFYKAEILRQKNLMKIFEPHSKKPEQFSQKTLFHLCLAWKSQKIYSINQLLNHDQYYIFLSYIHFIQFQIWMSSNHLFQTIFFIYSIFLSFLYSIDINFNTIKYFE